jgi:hypothetical protein
VVALELSPEQIAEFDALSAKKKAKLQRQKQLQTQRSQVAASKNEEEGWPMPLRMSEADAIYSATTSRIGLLYRGQVFKTKNTLISRTMTFHEVVKRRYVMGESRALLLKHMCPFPGCKYTLEASFKSLPQGPFPQIPLRLMKTKLYLCEHP